MLIWRTILSMIQTSMDFGGVEAILEEDLAAEEVEVVEEVGRADQLIVVLHHAALMSPKAAISFALGWEQSIIEVQDGYPAARVAAIKRDRLV